MEQIEELVLGGPNSNTSGSKVSVAMATYNGEKYIREQLDSLAAQTVLPFELVITDDGSTDQTLSIVENFSRTSQFPVWLYRNDGRLGFADNFLRAASICKGDLIAFCDQDDVWLPGKIQQCVAALDTSDKIVAVHASLIWYGDNMFGNVMHGCKKLTVLEPSTTDPLDTKPGFSMVFRRQVLEISNAQTRPRSNWNLDAFMSHDEWIWFLATIFGRCVLMPDVLAWYRQHQTNVAGAPRKRSFKEYFVSSVKATKGYVKRAEFYFECSNSVQSAASYQNENKVELATEAAARLRANAKYFALRAIIYFNRSSFWMRLKVISKLLAAGGYSLGMNRKRFSILSFIKDIFLGVLGLYKLFPVRN